VANDVLIVDDESDIQLIVGGILEDEGYSCRKAGDSDTALAALHARQPNIIILDVWLQGSRVDGIELLGIVKREYPLVPVVMISGHGTIETAVAAIKEGAYDFIEKPFKADRLVLMVGRAIEQARLLRENVELRMRAGGDTELIGSSTVINQLRQSIQRVAPTGSRVLITGPAGSGKEVVARLIHAGSHRAEAPFTVVNCAAMRPEFMETELFGTEPSTSDKQAPRKIGSFEQAHGGTLFLDEVSDMPFETQGKIVRVLQEQTFERVGGATRVEVDVRVMASSHKDLTVEMAEGRFREDLFYRLNVVPIRVPALNERKGDIPLLAEHFITQAAVSTGRPPRRLGDDALAAFQSYEWPGNVRQLKNAIDWLLIMAPGGPDDPIRADMLPPEIGAITPESLKGESGGELMSLPLREARETFEREYLLAQVTRFGGNISRTAAFVGMERTALHRKLKALGLYDADKPSLRG
jgi:two-component system nitrogen regulation response regulator NtrX